MAKLPVLIATVGVMAILFGAGGYITGALVQRTSSNEFCVSCHEMASTVYEEYKKTTHFENQSGVRAGCADCHIPHDWGTTLLRKVLAAKDVYHHFIGTLDTPEKFEAHRLTMAETVWASMKASDSRECRNCHLFDAMRLEKQRPRARKQHENAMKNHETCIDCHKGIAHKPVHPQPPQNENELQLEF